MNAKGRPKYQQKLQELCKGQIPELSMQDGELYAAIYYFHKVPATQDADNISKPILDALKGLMYTDDRVVKLRQAAMVDLRSRPLELLDLSRMPDSIFGAFIEELDSQDYTVYIEIGRLDYRQIQFGYETLYEV
jgi:hypothetical protein